MKLLFEPFRQLDGSPRRVYEGTGLGLHLCRKLLGLMGGDIQVQSEIRLLARASASRCRWICAPHKPYRRAGRRCRALTAMAVSVLLVEDNEVNRYLVRFVLEKAGSA